MLLAANSFVARGAVLLLSFRDTCFKYHITEFVLIVLKLLQRLVSYYPITPSDTRGLSINHLKTGIHLVRHKSVAFIEIKD